MANLSEASIALARARPRVHDPQPELPNLPEPLTANRARDFGFNAAPPCKRCQIPCGYCAEYAADHGIQPTEK